MTKQIRTFGQIADKFKHDENAMRAALAEEQAKFIISIKDYSKEHLISMLGNNWLESGFHEAMGSKIVELINSQKEFLQALKKSEQRRDVFDEEVLESIKNAIKRIEYLKNILGQRNEEKKEKKKILNKGREMANQNRQTKGEELEQKLKTAIKQLIAARDGIKTTNKYIEDTLGKSFIRPKGSKTEGYSAKTFTRKVAVLTAEIKNESPGQ